MPAAIKRRYQMHAGPPRGHHNEEAAGYYMGWDEIGARMGITRQRAQQIARVALYKLRRNETVKQLARELGIFELNKKY